MSLSFVAAALATFLSVSSCGRPKSHENDAPATRATTSAAKLEGTLQANYAMCGFESEADYKSSMVSESAYPVMCEKSGTRLPNGLRVAKANANWTGGCEFLVLEGELKGTRQWGPCAWMK